MTISENNILVEYYSLFFISVNYLFVQKCSRKVGGIIRYLLSEMERVTFFYLLFFYFVIWEDGFYLE